MDDNAANPEASQNPWDAPGYKMPGGTPKSPALAAFLPAFPALLRTQTKGAVYPAARAILSAAIEGANTDFDTASRIESRYLANLVVNQGSKNMIQAFFFDLQAINSGSLRPQGIEPWKATKVGVLGAGMMGAGIAYVCAKAGMEVVLKDVAVENAEKGKAYSEGLLDKAISRGRSTEEKKAELLGRITATANPEDLTGCDLVIEAVFEDPSLKAKVFAEIAPFINKDALLCSNTSTLPITQLAEGVDRPADFIGLHFFSPVDKMPLVEIITGKETNDVALAKAYDVVQQIRKTPIVVNDSRGFYTSRVIGYMVNEGMAMLAEGVAPYSIERGTLMAGYPAAVLQLSDELNLELMAKIAKATKEGELAAGNEYVGHPGIRRRRQDARGRPCRSPPWRGLLRLRGRQARLDLGRSRGAVPRRRGADPDRGHQGPDAVRRGPRDREVLRGGRHHLGGRREHRLDHGHRLPADDRWRRPVHDRLRAKDGPARTGRSVSTPSSSGPTTWPPSTATGSRPPRGCGTSPPRGVLPRLTSGRLATAGSRLARSASDEPRDRGALVSRGSLRSHLDQRHDVRRRQGWAGRGRRRRGGGWRRTSSRIGPPMIRSTTAKGSSLPVTVAVAVPKSFRAFQPSSRPAKNPASSGSSFFFSSFFSLGGSEMLTEIVDIEVWSFR